MGDGPRDWTPSEPRWGQRSGGFEGVPAGLPEDPRFDSPFEEVHRRSQRRMLALIWTASALLVIAVVVTIGGRFLPLSARESIVGAAPALSGLVGVPAAGSELARLAADTFLTERGREVLYATHPELIGDEVAQLCSRPEDVPGDEVVAAGCYAGWLGAGRIYVFRPGDDRLLGSMVTITAHELLHAAYDRMDAAQQRRIDELVAAETERLAPDDPTRTQIDWSVGSYESNRGTEQFAYLGSQVLLDGGFAPELEAIYAEWFTDRVALVEVYRSSITLLDELVANVQSAWDTLAAREQDVVNARAQYDADRAWLDVAVSSYNDDVAWFNALPADQRTAWTSTFTNRQGAEATMSYSDALAYRYDEIEQLKAELEARGPALDQQESDAAAERAQVQASHDDLTRLLDAAYPGRG